MKRIAIFASGKGTNAERIIRHFKNHPFIKVAVVISSRADAGVLEVAVNYHIPAIVLDKKSFFETDHFVQSLQHLHIDLVVLAGFLWKIPENLIRAFPGRIINIHPALLPKFGGKGMYGMHVHNAVIISGEKESGISIHYVNEHYDEGVIILQEKCSIHPNDTAEKLAKKIQRLEHRHYPAAIEGLLKE